MRQSAGRNKCPCCGAFARIRNSKLMDDQGLYRTGVIECTDIDCGWRGQFDLTITKTLVESSKRGEA